ncbi:class I SAM-dependent methyltransferase [Lacisediminihabitans sp. FW035]
MDEELREHTRAAYDAVASDYATIIPDTGFEAPLDLAMVNEFVNKVAKRPGSRILDAGCGAGRMVTYLQSQSPSLDVVGIDLSVEMIALAQSAHPDAEFRQADFSDTQFPEREFDGILAWYSIIHTEPDQLAEIVAEFARILRPEGLVLLGYQAGTGERQLNRPYGHDVELRAFLHQTDDVIATLIDGGFNLIAKLDRAPRTSERHAQGFVLARCQ